MDLIARTISSFRLLRGAVARCLLIAVPLAISPAAHAAYNLTFVTDPTGEPTSPTCWASTIPARSPASTMTITNAGFTAHAAGRLHGREFSGRGRRPQVTGINAAGDLSGFYVDTARQYAWLHAHRRHVHDRRQSRERGLQPGARHQQFGRDRRLLRADTAGTDRAKSRIRRKGGGVHRHQPLLPANVNSQAVGINSDATPWIVGFYQPDSYSTSFGFVDEGGTITPIDPFGSTFTQALGVNDLGEIVGFYVDASRHAARLYRQRRRLHQLRPAGLGLDDDQRHERQGRHRRLLYQRQRRPSTALSERPVPEPSTWAMMLAGFAGLGFLGYRKVRQGKLAA